MTLLGLARVTFIAAAAVCCLAGFTLVGGLLLLLLLFRAILVLATDKQARVLDIVRMHNAKETNGRPASR